MPKNNTFKQLVLISAILIITAVIIKYMYSKTESSNEPQTNTKTRQILNDLKSNKDKKNVPEKLKTIKLKQDPENHSNLPLLYSNDPFINSTIILGIYFDCINLFQQQKHQGIQNSYSFTKGSQKLQQKILKRYKYCQKIDKEYPDFHLKDGDDFFETPKGSNSILEQALNSEFKLDKEPKLAKDFIQEIKQTNTKLLLNPFVANLIFYYHMEYSIANVMKALQTQEIYYILELLERAQTLYACNINGGCDKNSATMYMLCIQDEVYCDLENYNEYTRLTMTKGQQADIAIIVRYFENLFQHQ